LSAQGSPACGASDSVAAANVRLRLAGWVAATNRGDRVTSDSIWAPGVVGWFPQSGEFSDSAAFAAAAVPRRPGIAFSTYELTIEDLVVAGPIAVVHDLWRETRHFRG